MSLLRIAAIVGGLTLAFTYHGPAQPFAWAVAVFLAVGFALLSRKRSDFAPFAVRIWPTRALLIETGLATDEEVKAMEEGLRAAEDNASYGWYALRSYNRPRHSGEHSFLRDGIWFTVLKSDNFDQTSLVYWNEFKVFTTAIKWELFLKELPRPVPEPVLSGDTLEPRLYLDPEGNGLSLRVATVKDILGTDEGLDPGREVAVLPWAEFRSDGWWQNQEKMRKRRDAQLAKHGWTREENESPWMREHSELRHKLFTVEWYYV